MVQEALHHMPREVGARADAARKRQVELHNRRKNMQPLNISVGDFVLVRRAVSAGHKLNFKWTGPRRVITAKSELVFEVEDLLQRKSEAVHARHRILYLANMDRKTAHPTLVRAAEHNETTYQDAPAPRVIHKTNEGIEL